MQKGQTRPTSVTIIANNMTIEKLIDIVRNASKLMLTDTFEIAQKGGYSNIVTTSDVAVQDYLCQQLADALPGSGFLCEEADQWDTNHEYTWVIDPIDGTANYSRGIDHCCVCVGLKQHDRMQRAVVYLPRTDELFHAERGKGAYLNGRRIHVSDRPFENSLLCTALPVYHKEYAEVCSDIIKDTFLQINDLRRFGSAATELCYLAMGRCELYFEYLLSPWDFAAASLILEEAGGVLSDLSALPLNYIHGSGVLAANTPENLNRLQTIVAHHTQAQ